MKNITLKVSKQEALWIFIGLHQNEKWTRENMTKEPELADQIKALKSKLGTLIINHKWKKIN